MKWVKTEVDPTKVRSLSKVCKLDPITAEILTRRGWVAGDELRFFMENELHFLHSPFLFDEMEEAIARLREARVEDERVLVFGDRDADGMSATALMVETLQEYGLSSVEWQVPKEDEPYGLSLEAVERFAKEDGTLIVTVDCGTSNRPEIERASALGVDVIVIDHHNPPEALPPARAIVNPKISDSSYPFDGLCACVVVAKVRWALSFSQTQFYNREICLLHGRPVKDVCLFDLIKMRNGIEMDRLHEALAPKIVSPKQARLTRFVEGLPLFCWDEPLQRRMMQQVFGDKIELECFDLSTEMAHRHPALQNKSLLQIGALSRLACYDAAPPGEIDVLARLYWLFAFCAPSQLADTIGSALDLLAIGTIADVVPLRNENRIVVQRGLRGLQESSRPGLQALLRQVKLAGRPFSVRDVSFQLTPVINSAGRLGCPQLAVRLLLTHDPQEAEDLSTEIVALNKRRRKISVQSWDRLLPRARESHRRFDTKFVLVHDTKVARGVTGLLAGRLSHDFKAPAVVIAILDGKAIGSMRSIEGFSATAFLKQLEDLLLEWGGHDAAAGFRIEPERLPALEQRILSLLPTITLKTDEQSINIDIELPSGEWLKPELAKIARRFEPFGQANRPPIFLVRNVVVDQLDIIGKQDSHLRMLVDAGTCRWPARYWSAAPRVGVDFGLGDHVDLLFEIERNHYGGVETPRLKIIDLQRTSIRKPINK